MHVNVLEFTLYQTPPHLVYACPQAQEQNQLNTNNGYIQDYYY